MKAWLAKDSTAIGGVFAICLFSKKPQISNAGFWTLADGAGRYPIDLKFQIKEGECRAISISDRLPKIARNKSDTIEGFQRTSFEKTIAQ